MVQLYLKKNNNFLHNRMQNVFILENYFNINFPLKFTPLILFSSPPIFPHYCPVPFFSPITLKFPLLLSVRSFLILVTPTSMMISLSPLPCFLSCVFSLTYDDGQFSGSGLYWNCCPPDLSFGHSGPDSKTGEVKGKISIDVSGL